MSKKIFIASSLSAATILVATPIIVVASIDGSKRLPVLKMNVNRETKQSIDLKEFVDANHNIIKDVEFSFNLSDSKFGSLNFNGDLSGLFNIYSQYKTDSAWEFSKAYDWNLYQSNIVLNVMKSFWNLSSLDECVFNWPDIMDDAESKVTSNQVFNERVDIDSGSYWFHPINFFVPNGEIFENKSWDLYYGGFKITSISSSKLLGSLQNVPSKFTLNNEENKISWYETIGRYGIGFSEFSKELENNNNFEGAWAHRDFWLEMKNMSNQLEDEIFSEYVSSVIDIAGDKWENKEYLINYVPLFKEWYITKIKADFLMNLQKNNINDLSSILKLNSFIEKMKSVYFTAGNNKSWRPKTLIFDSDIKITKDNIKNNDIDKIECINLEGDSLSFDPEKIKNVNFQNGSIILTNNNGEILDCFKILNNNRFVFNESMSVAMNEKAYYLNFFLRNYSKLMKHLTDSQNPWMSDIVINPNKITIPYSVIANTSIEKDGEYIFDYFAQKTKDELKAEQIIEILNFETKALNNNWGFAINDLNSNTPKPLMLYSLVKSINTNIKNYNDRTEKYNSANGVTESIVDYMSLTDKTASVNEIINAINVVKDNTYSVGLTIKNVVDNGLADIRGLNLKQQIILITISSALTTGDKSLLAQDPRAGVYIEKPKEVLRYGFSSNSTFKELNYAEIINITEKSTGQGKKVAAQDNPRYNFLRSDVATIKSMNPNKIGNGVGITNTNIEEIMSILEVQYLTELEDLLYPVSSFSEADYNYLKSNNDLAGAGPGDRTSIKLRGFLLPLNYVATDHNKTISYSTVGGRTIGSFRSSAFSSGPTGISLFSTSTMIRLAHLAETDFEAHEGTAGYNPFSDMSSNFYKESGGTVAFIPYDKLGLNTTPLGVKVDEKDGSAGDNNEPLVFPNGFEYTNVANQKEYLETGLKTNEANESQLRYNNRSKMERFLTFQNKSGNKDIIFDTGFVSYFNFLNRLGFEQLPDENKRGVAPTDSLSRSKPYGAIYDSEKSLESIPNLLSYSLGRVQFKQTKRKDVWKNILNYILGNDRSDHNDMKGSDGNAITDENGNVYKTADAFSNYLESAGSYGWSSIDSNKYQSYEYFEIYNTSYGYPLGNGRIVPIEILEELDWYNKDPSSPPNIELVNAPANWSQANTYYSDTLKLLTWVAMTDPLNNNGLNLTDFRFCLPSNILDSSDPDYADMVLNNYLSYSEIMDINANELFTGFDEFGAFSQNTDDLYDSYGMPQKTFLLLDIAGEITLGERDEVLENQTSAHEVLAKVQLLISNPNFDYENFWSEIESVFGEDGVEILLAVFGKEWDSKSLQSLNDKWRGMSS